MSQRFEKDNDYILVSRLDSTGGVLFNNLEEARSTGEPSDHKYSQLDQLEQMRGVDGKFQFKLYYPEYPERTNTWKQSNNFAAFNSNNKITNGLIAGGEGVVEALDNSWSTLEKKNPGSSKYVLKHNDTDNYIINIPQSRLLPDTEYTLYAWVGAESKDDINTSSLYGELKDDNNITTNTTPRNVHNFNGNSYGKIPLVELHAGDEIEFYFTINAHKNWNTLLDWSGNTDINEIWVNNNRILSLRLGNGTNNTITSASGSIDDNIEYKVNIKINANNTYSAYIDDVLIGTSGTVSNIKFDGIGGIINTKLNGELYNLKFNTSLGDRFYPIDDNANKIIDTVSIDKELISSDNYNDSLVSDSSFTITESLLQSYGNTKNDTCDLIPSLFNNCNYGSTIRVSFYISNKVLGDGSFEIKDTNGNVLTKIDFGVGVDKHYSLEYKIPDNTNVGSISFKNNNNLRCIIQNISIKISQEGSLTNSGAANWVGYENVSGYICDEIGNEQEIDGVFWERRHWKFKTPSDLAVNGYFTWSIGRGVTKPKGDKFYTNIMFMEKPIDRNYDGDYDAFIGGVRGYEDIDIGHTGNSWGGIEYNGINSLADGSVDTAKWFMAVGSFRSHANEDSHPGPGFAVTVSELYVYCPIGLTIADKHLHSKHVSESGYIENSINISGVSNTSSKYSSAFYNNDDLIKTLARANGQITVITWANINTKPIIRTYDNTLQSNRTAMANELDAIKDTEKVFAIVSNGNLYTDNVLDASILQFNATEWRGTDYYNIYGYSYAAIGTGKLGIVTERSMFDHPLDGESETGISFNTFDDIGTTGFGEELLNSVFTGSVPIDVDGIAVGQNVIVTSFSRKSIEDVIGDVDVSLEVVWLLGTDIVKSDKLDIDSTLKTKHELYSDRPIGADGCVIKNNALADFITVYKSGMSKPKSNTVSISEYGIACDNLVNTPVAGNPMSADSWYRLATSNSNLLSGVDIQQKSTDAVYWGDRVLTDNTQKSYLKSSNDNSISTDFIPIPDKESIYYCSWYVYVADVNPATTKTLKFDLRVRDASGTFLNITDAITSNFSSFYRFKDINGSELTKIKDQWVLFDGWILPNSWTKEQCIAFQYKNASCFGLVDDLGISMEDKGLYSSFCQLPNSAIDMQLGVYDNTNGNISSDIMTALPIISKLKDVAWDQHEVYTPNFTENIRWVYNFNKESYIKIPTIQLSAGDEVTFKYISNTELPTINEFYFRDDGTTSGTFLYNNKNTGFSWQGNTISSVSLDGVDLIENQGQFTTDGLEHTIKVIFKSDCGIGIIGNSNISEDTRSNSIIYDFKISSPKGGSRFYPIDDGLETDSIRELHSGQHGTRMDFKTSNWSTIHV